MSDIKQVNFKKYYPRFKRRNEPMVTIYSDKKNKSYGIMFNHPCNPFLQRKDFVEIFYSNKDKMIALRPMHIDTEYSLRILKPSNPTRGNLWVCCSHFLKSNKILEYLGINGIENNRQARRVKAIWDNKNKCFLIKLKNIEKEMS